MSLTRLHDYGSEFLKMIAVSEDDASNIEYTTHKQRHPLGGMKNDTVA